MAARPGRPAYTVVEMMVVIAILAALIAVGLPMFNSWMAGRALSAAEYRVAGDLRQVLAMAVNQGGQTRLHSGSDAAINMASSTGVGWQYRLERCTAACNLPANWLPVIPASNAWYDMARDVRGAALIGIADSTPTSLIDVIFDSQGRVTTTSPPANPTYPIFVTVGIGGQQRTITVTRVGGIRTP